MELELISTYYPDGTNGKILYQGRLMLYSIELPWKENQAAASCIAEGRYEHLGPLFPLMQVNLLMQNALMASFSSPLFQIFHD